MELKQVKAKIKIKGEEKEAWFDTGATLSVMPKELALKFGDYLEYPAEDQFEVVTAKKGAKVRIIGECSVSPEIAGCKIPRTTFKVSEDVEGIIIGLPEIDSWGIVFTPEGPKPKECPIRMALI
ncbi:MAG: hypothetical protein QXR87_02460 [Candidatus Hadarchaeales archaeon]|nr:MAG: hypothetical protein DSO03_03235 [Hadesarchaea archaeon]